MRAGCARTRLRLVHGRFVVGHSRAFLFMIVVVRLSVKSHSVDGTFMLPLHRGPKNVSVGIPRIPGSSVERQCTWSGRDHSDLLQQLQNVGTQPVFDEFPSFDAKEVHARILDAFANGVRRSPWNATLIRAAKDPATSNQIFIGKVH